MIDVVPVAIRETHIRARIRSDRRARAHHGVAVLIVVGIQAVGRESGDAHRVAGDRRSAGQIDRSVQRGVGSRLQLRAHAGRLTLTRAREDLHDARHRIGAVQHADRAAHDLDPVHVIGRQMGKIDPAARLIERHTVQEHLHVIALAAAHEQRRLPTDAASLHDVDTGNGL